MNWQNNKTEASFEVSELCFHAIFFYQESTLVSLGTGFAISYFSSASFLVYIGT